MIFFEYACFKMKWILKFRFIQKLFSFFKYIWFALLLMRFYSSIWNKMSLSMCCKMFLWDSHCIIYFFSFELTQKYIHIQWCQRNAVAVVDVTTFKLQPSMHKHMKMFEEKPLKMKNIEQYYSCYLSWYRLCYQNGYKKYSQIYSFHLAVFSFSTLSTTENV